MNKNIFIELINKNYSQRKIGEELKISQSNVRYWLKKYGINTKNKKHNVKEIFDEKRCPICDEIKPINEFYINKNRKNRNSYCKKCSNEYHTKRMKSIKLKMIQHKGSECLDCGLHLNNTHYSVFDFHHLNPNEKDINFKRIKFQKWNKIIEELDKCVLLCSNCHRIRHANIEGW